MLGTRTGTRLRCGGAAPGWAQHWSNRQGWCRGPQAVDAAATSLLASVRHATNRRLRQLPSVTDLAVCFRARRPLTCAVYYCCCCCCLPIVQSCLSSARAHVCYTQSAWPNSTCCGISSCRNRSCTFRRRPSTTAPSHRLHVSVRCGVDDRVRGWCGRACACACTCTRVCGVAWAWHGRVGCGWRLRRRRKYV